jgi:hypothetical protein
MRMVSSMDGMTTDTVFRREVKAFSPARRRQRTEAPVLEIFYSKIFYRPGKKILYKILTEQGAVL